MPALLCHDVCTSGGFVRGVSCKHSKDNRGTACYQMVWTCSLSPPNIPLAAGSAAPLILSPNASYSETACGSSHVPTNHSSSRSLVAITAYVFCMAVRMLLASKSLKPLPMATVWPYEVRVFGALLNARRLPLQLLSGPKTSYNLRNGITDHSTVTA